MQVMRCTRCMGELQEGVRVCPHCGYEQNSAVQPGIALKRNTILHGRYLIGNVIGQGGFGITYVGWDLTLEMKVAVKEYFPSGSASRTHSISNEIEWDSINQDSENRSDGMERFLKEARRMARLDEVPSIVRVRDAFGENQTAYIVMDFVEGVTLKKYLLGHGVLRYDECMKLLSPILDSLAVIHDHGFIHRDISPDNIMLRPDGSARLLDMGAAVDVTANGGHASMAVIKRNFSAPEQYMESERLGSWTDVYAMGATIYYCMTGKVVPEALEREFKKVPLFFDPGLNIPEHVVDALNNALELHAEKRIQDMREFKRRLAEPKKEVLPELEALSRPGRPEERQPEFQEVPPTTPFQADDGEMKTTPYTGEAAQEQKTEQTVPYRLEKEEKKEAPKNKRVLIYAGVAAGAFLIILFFTLRPSNSVDLSNTAETSMAKVTTTDVHVTTAIPEITTVPETTAAREPIDTSKYVDVELSDLDYQKTDDGKGIVLTKYNGAEIFLKLPDEIEGLPVLGLGNDFCYEHWLRGVILPKELQDIDSSAFSHCVHLREIELPKSLKTIGANAFCGCLQLKAIDLPEGITTIGIDSFYDTGLQEITIPSTVDTLKYGACILDIPQVNIEEDNRTYVKRDGIICKNDGELTAFPRSRQGTFVIPSEFNSIGDYAFYKTSLGRVTIPGSVGVVGRSAFTFGDVLYEVVIEEGVEELGNDSFKGCTSLSKVTIPRSVKKIGEYAFALTSLSEITIPGSVAVIESGTCDRIEELQRVVIEDGVEELKSYSFKGCKSLSEVSIPKSVKKIGKEAFKECDSLKTVTISKDCEIDKTAFDPDVVITYYD